LSPSDAVSSFDHRQQIGFKPVWDFEWTFSMSVRHVVRRPIYTSSPPNDR
jgi:hypothetical protein